MSKIRTTCERDVYGSGYKQEITFDNGKSYKIQTNAERDPYGSGNTKEIVDTEATANALGLWGILAVLIMYAIVSTVFIGGSFLIFKFMGIW